MKVILPALMFVCFAVLSPAEEIKSADGKVIEAEVVEIAMDGVKLDRAGTVYLVPWEKLDAEQAMTLKVREWIKVKEDKFDDHITISTESKSGSIDLDCVTYLQAKYAHLPNHFYFSFTRTGPSWEWLKFHPVKMLIDGEKQEELEAEIDSDVFSGGTVYERVSIRLSDQLLSKMAAAKQIEFKVGLTEMRLDYVTNFGLQILRDFSEAKRQALLATKGQ